MINILGSDGLQLSSTYTLFIVVYSDSDGAVKTITNPGTTSRTRHFERWVHYGREQFLNLVSVPRWVSTSYQVADIFTKPLDLTTFIKFRNTLLNFGRANAHPTA